MKISTSVALLLTIGCSTPAMAQCTVTPSINNGTNYSAVNASYDIPCGSSTANLSSLTASNQPGGTTLTWHTATPATTANKITPVTSVGGGTRKVYASFFDGSINCYAPTQQISIYAAVCAGADDYSATPVTQGVATALPSIFANDTYNGAGFTLPNANVQFAYELWNLSYATVNEDGTINVLPSTPAGTYTFMYKIIDTDPDAVVGSSSDVGVVTIVVTSALPVSLSHFDVAKQGNSVQLNWATASEQNNAGFTVERSAQGADWKAIGFIASKSAAAGSHETTTYSFLDKQPFAGENYYRLKQTDLDGKSTYSSVKNIIFTVAQRIQLYPNPVKDKLTIEGLSGGAVLKIYDVTGRMIHQQQASSSVAVVSLQGYKAGMYQVQVITAEGAVANHKVVKLQ